MVGMKPLATHEDRYSAIGFMLLTKHDFRCVNVSNEARPWYAPIPLMPTPPNGNDSTANTIHIWY